MQCRLFVHLHAVDIVFARRLAFSLGSLVSQAACRYREATDEGSFDHQPNNQQVQGFDQAIAEFQGGVEIAHANRHAEAYRQGNKAQADGLAQRRGVLANRCTHHQLGQQPGHG